MNDDDMTPGPYDDLQTWIDKSMAYILHRIPDLEWSEYSDPITALCDRLEAAERRNVLIEKISEGVMDAAVEKDLAGYAALRDGLKELADEWENDSEKYAELGKGRSRSHAVCRQISHSLGECSTDLRALLETTRT